MVDVSFPNLYESFIEIVALVKLPFRLEASLGCKLDLHFHDELIAKTVGPLVLLGLYIAIDTYPWQRCNREVFSDRFCFVIYWWTVFLYSPVTSTVLEALACDNLDDGPTLLRADYRLECKSNFYTVWAWVAVLVYPFGIALWYWYILYNGRDRTTGTGGRAEVNHTWCACLSGFWSTNTAVSEPAIQLSEDYTGKRGCYFYELWECARRVLLAGIVVFILPQTGAQIAITFLMELFFLLVSEVMRPFDKNCCTGDRHPANQNTTNFCIETWVYRFGQLVVLITMFEALLLKTDVSAESKYSQYQFGVTLILTHCVLIGTVFVGCCFTCTRSARSECGRGAAGDDGNSEDARSLLFPEWSSLGEQRKATVPTSDDDGVEMVNADADDPRSLLFPMRSSLGRRSMSTALA